MAEAAKIVAVEGKLKGRSWSVVGPLIIGRSPEASIRVPDGKASREHSKVYVQGGDYYIVDLNSVNGTYVNDTRVTKKLLRSGDEIRIGTTRLRFDIPAPEPEATPEKVRRPKEPAYREVIDLTKKPEAAPAGAIRADEIVIKDRALQFSKNAGKKSNLFTGALDQRPFAFQLIVAVVVIAISIIFIYLGLMLGGFVGGE